MVCCSCIFPDCIDTENATVILLGAVDFLDVSPFDEQFDKLVKIVSINFYHRFIYAP